MRKVPKIFRFDDELQLIVVSRGGASTWNSQDQQNDDIINGVNENPLQIGYSISDAWQMIDINSYDFHFSSGLWDNSLVTSPLSGRALFFHELARITGITGIQDVRQLIDKIQGLSPVIVPGVIVKNHPAYELLLQNILQITTNKRIFTTVIDSLKSIVEAHDEMGYCLRCASMNLVSFPDICPRCGNYCYSCRDCHEMGESRECTPLFLFPDTSLQTYDNTNYTNHTNHTNHKLILDFQLTPAQERAYDMAVDFVEADSANPNPNNPDISNSAIIHAVCGAGKTETVFGALLSVLKRGGRVLYTTPRRDLVKELDERLIAAFPNTAIQALFGGSRDNSHEANLIIATTHQVMRFYSAFDLVILDEVDAFPYHGSERLPHLINRARKTRGSIAKTIYITATPHDELLASSPERITIPARYHGYPAPEPKLIKSKLDKLPTSKQSTFKSNSVRLPSSLTDFFHRHIGKSPVFAFVPTVSMVEPVVAGLKSWCRSQQLSAWIQGVSSRDPDRDEKRHDFHHDKLDILVTTTIMERGITVARAKVVVLFAHHQVFDKSTLIQIAGRSGRKKQDPVGEVLFVGDYISKDMKAAHKAIAELNREARQLGYIK